MSVAVIELEMIGDNYRKFKRAGITDLRATAANERYEKLLSKGGKPAMLPPFVARITGRDATGFQREYLRPISTDYSRANSTGSRGIYAYFVMSDAYYEVFERVNWTKSNTRYLKVTNGEIADMKLVDIIRQFPRAECTE